MGAMADGAAGGMEVAPEVVIDLFHYHLCISAHDGDNYVHEL